MKAPLVPRLVLLSAGLLGVGIGGAILFFPLHFYAHLDLPLARSSSLLSELRASGGLVFASGVLILLGALLTRLTFTSAVIASALYLSYGFSRLLGWFLDGPPDGSLFWAGGVELLVGLACALVLLGLRAAEASSTMGRRVDALER